MKIVNFKVLDPRIGKEIPYPKYVTDGSSGIDLRACIEKKKVIYPNSTFMVKTGISVYISDPKITAVILPRSGLGHNFGIVLGNLVGLIDSDYKGELLVSIWNRSIDKKFIIFPGDRIAQMVFLPVIKVKLNRVMKFPSCNKKNSRKEKGFGHSGIK
ncbi:Deoxyuridine 5'-triphosphate nucleotidohydrolase [Buchnera aphidicola (Tetraneura ulmi)]|uniref:dUTP diphosphatase n=1 Tax=Buchnera aphidicola TaxID=9 RepID=UPI003463CCD2